MSTISPNAANDELDLIAFAKKIWTRRDYIFRITVTFSAFGIVLAFLSPKEYTASSTFIPQANENGISGGAISGLASIAGVNLGDFGTSADIPPSLYPKFVSSINYKFDLLKAPITVNGISKPVTYYDYYENFYEKSKLDLVINYTIGLPRALMKLVKKEDLPPIKKESGGNLIHLSSNEISHFQRIDKQLSIQSNDKDGLVQLSFTMPDPLMAAQMTNYAVNLLQKEIIDFRIRNAKEQLKFTEDRYNEKKRAFEAAQAKLSHFRDRNQNLSSASFMNQLQNLESDYNFTFTVYSEMAKQLEQAKLNVAKETPIFSIISPVVVPTDKSAPNRVLILVVFIGIGLIFSLVFVLIGEFVKILKRQWNTV